MVDMDNNSYNACKSFIKNLNWFLQRDKQYLEANFNTWKGKNPVVYQAFKDTIADFDFSKIDQLVAKYFKYILENRDNDVNPTVLEDFEKKFLLEKDNLEILFENDSLEQSKIELIGVEIENKEVEKVTEAVKNFKISSKILIDNLTGTEDDLNDWFEKFEIKGNAADWNDDVKGIRLPAYLSDIALTVWKTQSAGDKINYNKSKKHILKNLMKEENFEQDFYGRKQNDIESVLEFYYKLTSLGDKIFESEEKKKSSILKVFWNGLRPNIKRMVIGAEVPTKIEVAVEIAKKTEKFLLEEENENTKLVTKVEKSDRISRNRLIKETNGDSRRSLSRSPSITDRPNNRSMTPFNGARSNIFRCFNCNGIGHMARDCFGRRDFNNGFNKNRDFNVGNWKRPIVTCDFCNKKGHLADKCYARLNNENRKSLNF